MKRQQWGETNEKKIEYKKLYEMSRRGFKEAT